MTSTPETLTLDICLGNYEQYFVKSSGVQVCVVGQSWQRILCMLSVIIHLIYSSNILDAILLYIIFTKVKHQTEKSKTMIGQKAYGVRKRYVLWVQLLIFNSSPNLFHFGNENTFWKWKHILKMKVHYENESTFWKWRHILKMKAHIENESTFWSCLWL